MPDEGSYKEVPRPDSVDKLIEYLCGSSAVADVSRESNQVIYVERTSHPPIRIYMTNTYIVGLADVYEIVRQVDDLDAIVTMSVWNSYTGEAETACKDEGIGLFTFKEILGAVFYRGKKFLDYIPPREREENQRPGRRA